MFICYYFAKHILSTILLFCSHFYFEKITFTRTNYFTESEYYRVVRYSADTDTEWIGYLNAYATR